MQTHKAMGTKLSIEEYGLVSDYCKRTGTTPSKLIRELLFEEIPQSPEGPFPGPSYMAGRNLFEYDKKTDTFTWSVELDSGKRVTVLTNLPPDYLKDLLSSLSDSLRARDELQGRQRKTSAPVPKKLIRGKR